MISEVRYLSAGGRPTVPYMASSQSWLAGRSMLPEPGGPGDLYMASPSIEPVDLEEVVYGRYDGSSDWRITLGPEGQDIASFTLSPGFHDPSPVWTPDGTQIAYIKHGAFPTYGAEIRRVDADGTNDTLLHTVSSPMQVFDLTYSPSGDYLMWHEIRNSSPLSGKIWTANADGSGAAAIYTATHYNMCFLVNIPAWQRNADVIGLCDVNPTPSGGSPSRFRTVNPDGSSPTTFYSDASALYRGMTRGAWLSDDSGIVLAKRTDGSSYTTGSTARLAGITVGGTAYEFSPTLDLKMWSTTGSDREYNPKVFYDGDQWRVFVFANDSGDDCLVSVLEDGSDYRIEHNLTDAGLGWAGFEWLSL